MTSETPGVSDTAATPDTGGGGPPRTGAAVGSGAVSTHQTTPPTSTTTSSIRSRRSQRGRTGRCSWVAARVSAPSDPATWYVTVNACWTGRPTHSSAHGLTAT